MNNETNVNVQYVSPLKKILMTIGELPSSYLETMSYYEMLVWFTEFLRNQVIPTVNNNAEAVQELQSLYEELRQYVNNYFDNLDVQEEINKKLDEMAEDGSLTLLIKNYVDPLYEEFEDRIDNKLELQDTQLDVIENKVDSLASGSPKGTYPTLSDLQTADPNHDNIYVVIDNGNWYYYDSTLSAWTAGGVYQATEDSESVDILNSKVESLDTMTTYDINHYFTTFTQGRVTSNFNTKYGYSNSIKNNGAKYVYFDDTKYKILYYETDSEGVYTGNSGGWKTSSPAVFDKTYEYFGIEITTLNEIAVDSTVITDLLNTSYVEEEHILEIVDIVNNFQEDINRLISMPYTYLLQNVAGIGDSLISGVLDTGETSYTNYNESWLNYIAKKIGANFNHYSYGGATCKSWLNSQYKTQLENDTPSNAYFISLGTNDKNQVEYPIGSISDAVGSNSFVGYYKQIISTIHTKNPNAVIFCVSMYDNRNASVPYSEMVSDIADLYSYCYYIDFITNTEHTSKETSLYSENSHFTSVGYIYVANVIYKLLINIINSNISNFKWFGVNNLN